MLPLGIVSRWSALVSQGSFVYLSFAFWLHEQADERSVLLGNNVVLSLVVDGNFQRGILPKEV